MRQFVNAHGVSRGRFSFLRPKAGDPLKSSSQSLIEAVHLTAVKDRKGSVQSPKRVVVVDALPLTGLGKPDKKAVRAQFWEGAGRAVG